MLVVNSCILCRSNKLTSEKIGKETVMTCHNCHLQFLENYKNEHEYYLDYEEVKHNFKKEMKILRKKQYELDAAHFVKNCVPGSILDVGCSAGLFMHEIYKALPPYSKTLDFTGIDLDIGAIEFAQKNALSNMVYYCTDFLNFQTDKQFDTILFRGTLQYMSDDIRQTFIKLKKLLKENGKIIIYFLPSFYNFIFYLLKENWCLFDSVESKLMFNEDVIYFIEKEFELKLVELSYPYIGSAYENRMTDFNNVIDVIKNGKPMTNIPFYGNIMQIVFENKKVWC